MKNACTLVALLCLTLAGCRKAVTELQTKTLMEIITSGQWFIDQFTEGTTTYTQDYRGYDFKFNDNGTVNAYLASAVTVGTFSVDALNKRISSRFPAGSAPLLMRLNETWTVTNASLSLVEAKPSDPARTSFLRIRAR